MRRITLFRLDAIAFGYLTYFFTKNLSQISRNIKNIILIIFPIFLLASYIFFEFEIDILYIYSSSLAAILALLNALYIKESYFKKPLLQKTSAFLAHTSYCVYLIHFFVFMIFT